MCRFDAQSKCFNTSETCRFIHQDELPKAALSENKKLAKLAYDEENKGDTWELFTAEEMKLLKEWVNSPTTEENPLAKDLRKRERDKEIEELNDNIANLTVRAEKLENELDEIRTAINIKKRRWRDDYVRRQRISVFWSHRYALLASDAADSASQK